MKLFLGLVGVLTVSGSFAHATEAELLAAMGLKLSEYEAMGFRPEVSREQAKTLLQNNFKNNRKPHCILRAGSPSGFWFVLSCINQNGAMKDFQFLYSNFSAPHEFPSVVLNKLSADAEFSNLPLRMSNGNLLQLGGSAYHTVDGQNVAKCENPQQGASAVQAASGQAFQAQTIVGNLPGNHSDGAIQISEEKAAKIKEQTQQWQDQKKAEKQSPEQLAEEKKEAVKKRILEIASELKQRYSPERRKGFEKIAENYVEFRSNEMDPEAKLMEVLKMQVVLTQFTRDAFPNAKVNDSPRLTGLIKRGNTLTDFEIQIEIGSTQINRYRIPMSYMEKWVAGDFNKSDQDFAATDLSKYLVQSNAKNGKEEVDKEEVKKEKGSRFTGIFKKKQ